MTTEQKTAYEAWWSDPATLNNHNAIFVGGWEAALENRPIVVETIRIVARQQERHEIRERIMDKAVQAFCDGQDGTARVYRELADELFGKQTL